MTEDQAASLAADLQRAVHGSPGAPADTEPLPDVPDDLTTVDDLLGWVKDVKDDAEQARRAEAVLRMENDLRGGPGGDGVRKTLVDPLLALLPAKQPAGD